MVNNMVTSNFNRFLYLLGVATCIGCVALVFLLDLVNLSTKEMLFNIFALPVIGSLILFYPWLRIFKASKQGRDRPVIVCALLFVLCIVVFPAGVMTYVVASLIGPAPGLPVFLFISLMMILSLGTIAFLVGRWIAEGCRLYLEKRFWFGAFWATVGRFSFSVTSTMVMVNFLLLPLLNVVVPIQ